MMDIRKLQKKLLKEELKRSREKSFLVVYAVAARFGLAAVLDGTILPKP
jgi:hypothetical protein